MYGLNEWLSTNLLSVILLGMYDLLHANAFVSLDIDFKIQFKAVVYCWNFHEVRKNHTDEETETIIGKANMCRRANFQLHSVICTISFAQI